MAAVSLGEWTVYAEVACLPSRTKAVGALLLGRKVVVGAAATGTLRLTVSSVAAADGTAEGTPIALPAAAACASIRRSFLVWFRAR
jgi:hypothetical protein